MPTAENLFLLVISMLALESFRSIRFAWIHIISKFTDKSLNSFYYTLAYAAFEHHRWIAVTVRLALGCVPPSLRHCAVFLSIDDTMVEKYGVKFQARSKLFDHTTHDEYHINFKNFKAKLSSDMRVLLWNCYSTQRHKLMSLNLDPVGEYLSQLYSATGRPALRQAQILRSLILFAFLFNRTDARLSLTVWVREVLPSNPVLTGCRCADDLPPPDSYYDFMNRLCNASRDNYSRTCLLTKNKNGRKPKKVIGPDGKLIEPEPDTYATRNMVERIFHGESLSDGKQDILQTVFFLAAVLPSINKRGGSPDGPPDDISLDKAAHPLCRAGLRMCSWGYCKNKDAQKFRCPLACNRVKECPCSSECRKSSYGRTVYIKNSSDQRLHPRIPRNSEQYKTIYSECSACERMNDRVLNNYHLQDLKIRGDDHFSFWTMIIGICIHLDAWYKMSSMAKQTA